MRTGRKALLAALAVAALAAAAFAVLTADSEQADAEVPTDAKEPGDVIVPNVVLAADGECTIVIGVNESAYQSLNAKVKFYVSGFNSVSLSEYASPASVGNLTVTIEADTGAGSNAGPGNYKVTVKAGATVTPGKFSIVAHIVDNTGAELTGIALKDQQFDINIVGAAHDGGTLTLSGVTVEQKKDTEVKVETVTFDPTVSPFNAEEYDWYMAASEDGTSLDGLTLVPKTDGLYVCGMTTAAPADYTVEVVAHNENTGNEYKGQLVITVSGASGGDKVLCELQMKSDDGWSSINPLNGVNVVIQGTEVQMKVTKGSVSGNVNVTVVDVTSEAGTRQDATKTSGDDEDPSTYGIPTNGVGAYIIQVTLTEASSSTPKLITEELLNVIPDTTGAHAGFLVN